MTDDSNKPATRKYVGEAADAIHEGINHLSKQVDKKFTDAQNERTRIKKQAQKNHQQVMKAINHISKNMATKTDLEGLKTRTTRLESFHPAN